MESHLLLMVEQSRALFTDPYMVPMISSLRDYWLKFYCDVLMVKFLALMKASNWDYLMVKWLELYLEMYMESHLGLMLEQSWDL